MSSNRDFDREVTFEIVEEIGVIATHSTGWKKELNLVSWNGGQAKYDIRDWDPGHSRMSRGVTLKEQEMRQIVELLRRRRPHRRDREQEQGVMVDTPMDPAESFAEAPASSVSDGQSQAVPAAKPAESGNTAAWGGAFAGIYGGKRRSRGKCRDPNRCRARKRWQHPGKRMTTFLLRRFRI